MHKPTVVVSATLLTILLFLPSAVCHGSPIIRMRSLNIDTAVAPSFSKDPDFRRARAASKLATDLISDTDAFLVTLTESGCAWDLMHETGAVVTSFLPERTLVLVGDENAAWRAQELPAVLWVGYFRPAYKVSPDVYSLCKGNSLRTYDLYILLHQEDFTQHLVHTWKEALDRRLSSVDSLTLRMHAVSDRKIRVQIKTARTADVRDVVRWLAFHCQVEWIEPRASMRPHNRFAVGILQSHSSSHRVIHHHGLHGEGQILGCADTGVDFDHCMFYDNDTILTFGHPLEDHRKFASYYHVCTLDGCVDTKDVRGGHGTHVVGSMVGEVVFPSNDTHQALLARYNGVAFRGKIAFADVGKADGDLLVPDDLAAGLFPLTHGEAGAVVHSISWGCADEDPHGCNYYSSLAREIDAYAYTNTDFLAIIASGNIGDYAPDGTVGSPATAKNCIAVGASDTENQGFMDSLSYVNWAERVKETNSWYCTHEHDSCCPNNCFRTVDDCCREEVPSCCPKLQQDLYSQHPNWYNEENVVTFSSRGPTYDKRIKPDVAAPGNTIVSAYSDGDTDSYQCSADAPSAALVTMGGTSMAAPLLAGAAALIHQYFQEGMYPTGTRQPRDIVQHPRGILIKAILIHSGEAPHGQVKIVADREERRALPPLPNKYVGFGVVQLDRVLRFEDSPFDLWLAELDSNITRINATDHIVKFAFETTGPVPIEVTLAWIDYPANPAARTSLVNDLDLVVVDGRTHSRIAVNGIHERDTSNNVEHAAIEDAEKGMLLSVFVRGAYVPFGPVPFALVVTGALSPTASEEGPEDPGFYEDHASTTSSSSHKSEIIAVVVVVVALLLTGGVVLVKTFCSWRRGRGVDPIIMEGVDVGDIAFQVGPRISLELAAMRRSSDRIPSFWPSWGRWSGEMPRRSSQEKQQRSGPTRPAPRKSGQYTRVSSEIEPEVEENHTP